MAFPSNAVVLPSSSVCEPSALPASPTLLAAHPAPTSGRRRLAPESVNQPTSKGGQSRVGLRALAPSATNSDADVTASALQQTSAAFGEDLALAKENASLPTADRKEGAAPCARGTRIALPHTPRLFKAASPETAAVGPPQDGVSASTKAEETFDSPPVVSVTMTRRLANVKDPVEEKPAEPPRVVLPEANPPRPLRSTSTGAGPLCSPRRRAIAATDMERDDSADDTAVPPRAFPPASATMQPLKVEVPTDNEGDPRVLETTAGPSSEQIKAHGASARTPSADKLVKSSLSSVPSARCSPRTTPPLSPRQQVTNTGVAARTVRPALHSTSLASVELGAEASASIVTDAAAAAAEGDEKLGVCSTPAPSEEPKEPSPAPLATPRGAGTASRIDEIRARLAASRQQSMASRQLTPRSSVGSVAAAGAASASKDDAAAVEAASTIKALRQTLKDKDKEVALLAKDKARVEQLLAKATKRSEDLQGKSESAEKAFAAFKKEAAALRLETQKELRQAQSAARAAQAAQEKLRKELDKQKEKLDATLSRASSATATPVATPRGLPQPANGFLAADTGDVALRLKLTQVEKENKTLKESVETLKRELAAATAAAVDTAVKEAEKQQASLQEASREEAEKLKSEVARLEEVLAERDATLKSEGEEVQKLKAEVRQANAEKEKMELQWQKQQLAEEERRLGHKRVDASTLAVDLAGSYTPPLEPREEGLQPLSSSLSPRTPRQVVTFELSAREATAHLQEELTATQGQVSAYKRMQEHADRHIEQLEAKLESMQKRAWDAVEALQRRIKSENERRDATTSDAIALDAVKKELAAVRSSYNTLKQESQENSAESARLRAALEEAGSERDVYERQLRDLQQEHKESKLEATAAMQRLEAKMSAELKVAQGLLDATGSELHATREALQQRAAVVEELQAQVEALRGRCSEEKTRQASETEEAPGTAAADLATKQMERYKRKSRTLAKRLADVERELQVLGDEYTRVCGERDAAVLRYRTDESKGHALTTERERQPSVKASVDLSLHSDGMLSDYVSRSLTDALLSANRPAPTRLTADSLAAAVTAVASPVTAALAEEQRARAHLEKEVASLQAKVAEMEHPASPIMNALGTDWAEPLPSVESSGFMMLLPTQQHTRGTSSAPARARSPQTTHALDLRFFDPTTSEAAMPDPGKSVAGVIVRGSAASLSAAASQLSPHRSQAFETRSPRRASQSVSIMTKGAALDAIYAELPLPPVYPSARADSTDAAAAYTSTAACHLDLLFSTTAGALLVSKRGRHVHRPLVATRSLPRSSGGGGQATGDEGARDACCAALTSMSHAIYTSRMSAEGLFHLKYRYRFVVRVLADCDGGELMMGFADRYVPLESFGAKRNALRYKGCYYLNLQDGGLFAPSQGVNGKTYTGWGSAAETAAERRWQKYGGLAKSMECSFSGPSLPLRSSLARHSIAPPEFVARAGDEIACVLSIDERSISYEWNGVDCGVAFRGVSLSPSLYPCVEVNFSGGTVELL
ncbi:hypothetical protein ABL78_3676 [Leptomonas seymouri]|uniref:SPRY domain-containing protein n=1 Tax=Leptomonas seymouri TaxID=5684 RepID=A0A0N0P656_LEPSE|nr:hypothetical protein ABL78_3676 [Leptomonas seymouri]|eukprot:KPI87239.1 hypothetical protein ABL78_3676 [Leptomonas seymouri]